MHLNHWKPANERSLRWNWAAMVLCSVMAVGLVPVTAAHGQASPDARMASRAAGEDPPAANAAPQAPFPPLLAAEEQQLQRLLLAWQNQSQGTKTLECNFQCWTYDMFAAPAGIQSQKSIGVIKYAAPDKGLFKVNELYFFNGMQEGKPQFGAKDGVFGEHWVCNGEELIQFDHTTRECKIQELPPEMRGKNIINSPLPFVFNLDAEDIQRRYWVRQVQSPKEGLILIEAYPKFQNDRSQYRLVQIGLDEKTLMPSALLLYAPNFDVKTAPKWEHYEFTDVRRNSIAQGIGTFIRNFINDRPPADYKVFRDVLPTLDQAGKGNDSAQRR